MGRVCDSGIANRKICVNEKKAEASYIFGAFCYTRPIHYRYGGCGEPWLRLGDRRGAKQVG